MVAVLIALHLIPPAASPPRQAAGLGWTLLRCRTWSCGACPSAGPRASGSASPPPPSMRLQLPASRRPWARAAQAAAKGRQPRQKGWATSRTAPGTCRPRRTGTCTLTASPTPSRSFDAPKELLACSQTCLAPVMSPPRSCSLALPCSQACLA